jgi:hypothetical protein
VLVFDRYFHILTKREMNKLARNLQEISSARDARTDLPTRPLGKMLRRPRSRPGKTRIAVIDPRRDMRARNDDA